MSDFAQFLYGGTTSGAIYVLIGISVTLVYGLSRIINFAVGEFVTIGAFTAWLTQDATGSQTLGLLGAAVALAIVGLLADRGVFQFTYHEPLAGFIVSLGLIFVLQGLLVELFTSDARSVGRPPISGASTIGGVYVTNQTLLNTAIALALVFGLFGLLHRTTFGKTLRASSDDREAAALMGIRIRRVAMITFILGAALAGVAGWMVLTLSSVTPFIGARYVLRGFAVALVGGLGNIRGAVIAGLGLGVAENLSVGYLDPGWSELYVFLVVVLVLVWKPTGLAGGAEGARL